VIIGQQTGGRAIVNVIRMRVFATAMVLLSAGLSAQPKLKVYISVDMEGIAGVVSGDQLGPGTFEYERFRQIMTAEALAAVAGAKEAGATEILVSDSHGNGENLLVEQFPRDVQIIRSWPRRFSMMAGIDSTFDAAVFIGYHASTNSTTGVRAHTFSSARLTRVALNGREVSEGVWNSAIAGHFDVPVVFISGDESAIQENRRSLGDVAAAEVKLSLGFHSAKTLTPEAARQMIQTGVRDAVKNRSRYRPYRVPSPVTLDVSFKNYLVSEVLAYLKSVERTDAHSIRYIGADMTDVSDFMTFLTNYSLSLEP
jgi:D-amino peptidase